MTPTTHDWSLLNQLLQNDSAHSEQLLATLHDERKALESRDYAQFEALTQPKKQLVDQLEQNLAVRQQHLRQLGFASDTDALQSARKHAPVVAATWQAAAVLWQECQTANQVNEQICRRTRIVVERVLDVLRGQHTQSATYDASGTTRRADSGRTISSA
jgi:flagellar biosynthesis/type III secretory pathway chaperone